MPEIAPPVEVRSSPHAGELRLVAPAADQAEEPRKIRGYAAVFNSRSQVLTTEGGMQFVEVIAPGAFATSLSAGLDVTASYNHNANYPLGRVRAGTLRIFEDETGLGYETTLGTRSYECDLEQSLARGDVFGSSFTFAAVEDKWEEGPDGLPLRTLMQVHLFELGPVTNPAYRSASATARSLEAFVGERSARRAAAFAAAPAPPPDPAPTHDAPAPAALAASLALRLLGLR
jgi:HK97 family phage prohead protease